VRRPAKKPTSSTTSATISRSQSRSAMNAPPPIAIRTMTTTRMSSRGEMAGLRGRRDESVAYPV
jgi:hypothetical protein